MDDISSIKLNKEELFKTYQLFNILKVKYLPMPLCNFDKIAYYDIGYDIIKFNDYNHSIANLKTEALLHELIHWTGAKSRLNRPFMNYVDALRRSKKDIDQEEAIAQLGAYFLAKKLKFNMNNSKILTRLVFKYTDTNLINWKNARMEARKAVNFILKEAC